MAFTQLTPAVISKLPLGLLGFFGIKNGGQYPQTLGTSIAPTLEQLDILAANYFESAGAPPLVPSVLGFNPTVLQVPQGEIWYVSACSAYAFTGAGDTLTGTLTIRNTQTGVGSNWHRAVSPLIIISAGNASYSLPGSFRDFWMVPGDNIGGFFTAIVNASTTAQISPQIRFTRFPY